MDASSKKMTMLYDQAANGAYPEDRDRFWSLVTKTAKCWTFAQLSPNGYGYFSLWGRTYLAHRVSLIWSVGVPVNYGMMACHTCRDRGCVRPSHLYFGTARENSADRYKDGTSLSGENSPSAKISEKTAEKIRVMALEQGTSSGTIAAKLGLSKGIVKNVIAGVTFKDKCPPIKRGLVGIIKHYGQSGHPRAKLSEDDVLIIRREIHKGAKLKCLAERFNISTGMISQIKTRRSWSRLPDEQSEDTRRRRPKCRLSDDDVREIRKQLKQPKFGLAAQLAHNFGVSPTVISAIKLNQRYRDVK